MTLKSIAQGIHAKRVMKEAREAVALDVLLERIAEAQEHVRLADAELRMGASVETEGDARAAIADCEDFLKQALAALKGEES